MPNIPEQLTFGLVHGSWHDKWCWNLLQPQLETAGHKSVAMDLPIDDPTQNFDDYALHVADALEGHENIIGVFHSRAGNYGPRAVNIINERSMGSCAVRKMIFLASSFEPSTLSALGRPLPGEQVPARNDARSRSAIIERPDLGQDMTTFDAEKAYQILYQDVEDPELVAQAIAHLRPQNRPVSDPVMATWPEVEQEYIICEDDQIVRPEWSEYAARNWLQIEPTYIQGGHSPFLSRPEQLAQLLIRLSK